MTNGERIQTILDVDRDCTEVHGENGTMTFTVTQDFWNAEYQEPIPNNDLGVDCISRADARSLICKIDRKHHVSGMSWKAFKDLYNGIDELPSVTPQEKKGHWIPVFQGDEIIDYRCSCCEFGNTFGKGTVGMNYCPRCGSRNEVEK